MNSEIKALIEKIKGRLGLEKYNLHRYDIYREVTSFGETKYLLSMEYFPSHAPVPLEDESNPDGTVVVEVDIHDETWKSIVFVGGTTFATGVTIPSCSVEEVIQWVEAETGLTYNQDFYLHKADGQDFVFHACINQVRTYPDGWIKVSLDEEGRLISFAKHGTFPIKKGTGMEEYTLSPKNIHDLVKGQLELMEFLDVEEERRLAVYAIEEVFVTNEDTSTIPYNENGLERTSLTVNETVEWSNPIEQAFQGEDIIMEEDVTIEQALKKEPSPEATPISMEEVTSCIDAVRNFLRQEYKEDSGKWVLTTLHRDKGYIHATIRKLEEEASIFKRKITVLINKDNLTVDNYVDNGPLIEALTAYEPPKEVAVTKEVAFERLQDFIELIPYYVYDVTQERYSLCGKLESNCGVDAHTGEVISLDEL